MSTSKEMSSRERKQASLNRLIKKYGLDNPFVQDFQRQLAGSDEQPTLRTITGKGPAHNKDTKS